MKNLKLFEEFNGTLSNYKKVITISPSDMENLHKNGTVMIGDVEVAFNSDQNGKERRTKTTTQLGYSIVDNDVNNITESVNERINTDIVNRNINLLDKAADMAIKNPKGNVVELAKIIKKYVNGIRNSIKES